jgi:hypothetical protein
MTTGPGGQPPKLIVDTDWKAQAQAEKAKLSPKPAPGAPAGGGGANTVSPAEDADWKRQAQAEKEKLTQQTAATGESKPGRRGRDEPVTFDDLLSMLVTQALMYMGAFPDPRTGQAMVSLEYSKMYIDMLGVLQDKTKGNLTAEEADALSKTVTELRGEFVEVAKVVAKAVEEGRIRPMSAGGGGGMGGGMGGAMGGGGGGPTLKITPGGGTGMPPGFS